MPELVDGHNAIVVARPGVFADAMRRLAGDRAAADRLGRAAFEQFARELHAGAAAKRLLRLIETVR